MLVVAVTDAAEMTKDEAVIDVNWRLVEVVALMTAPPVNEAESEETAAPKAKFWGLVIDPPSTEIVFGEPEKAEENKNPVDPVDTTVPPIIVS